MGRQAIGSKFLQAAIKKTNRKLEQRIKSLEDRRGSNSASGA